LGDAVASNDINIGENNDSNFYANLTSADNEALSITGEEIVDNDF